MCHRCATDVPQMSHNCQGIVKELSICRGVRLGRMCCVVRVGTYRNNKQCSKEIAAGTWHEHHYFCICTYSNATTINKLSQLFNPRQMCMYTLLLNILTVAAASCCYSTLFHCIYHAFSTYTLPISIHIYNISHAVSWPLYHNTSALT